MVKYNFDRLTHSLQRLEKNRINGYKILSMLPEEERKSKTPFVLTTNLASSYIDIVLKERKHQTPLDFIETFRHLHLYPSKLWSEIMEKIDSSKFPELEDFLYSHTTRPHTNDQKRIAIPEYFIDYAGLKKENKVIVFGAEERIDIWKPETYKNYKDYVSNYIKTL